MKILAVLSHLMSGDCVLGCESAARAEFAIHVFKRGDHTLLVTNGWAYRADCATAISDVFENYILSNSDINPDQVLSESNSRDTVGDAYFLRKHWQSNQFSEITVITSDYHVNRTRIIFEKILGSVAVIEVLGVDTEKKLDTQTLRHEEESIAAFERTFEGTRFDSVESIGEAMSTRHPFYNGEIFAKLVSEP